MALTVNYCGDIRFRSGLECAFCAVMEGRRQRNCCNSAKLTDLSQKRHRKHAVLALPIKSVGVKGDRRSYEHPVMISGGANWDEVANLADELLKTVPGVNRCIWNLGSHAPKSVELLPATMTRARLDLLREADHIVMDGLRRHGLYDDIWQCPTALVPVKIDNAGQELCIVRPIHSERAMTAHRRKPTPAL